MTEDALREWCRSTDRPGGFLGQLIDLARAAGASGERLDAAREMGGDRRFLRERLREYNSDRDKLREHIEAQLRAEQVDYHPDVLILTALHLEEHF